MVNYIIAHDLGTSGNKATLFDTEGRLIRSMVASYDTHYFNGNWAEQNPEDWWKAICESTRALMEGFDKSRVAAISFSGQMMGCVLVDKQGTVLRPSIIWADMRAVEQERRLADQIGQSEFYHITGHKMSASYSIEKLMWVKDHQPEIYAKTYKMLNAKDYIILRMTGRFLTEYSDASGTNAFNLGESKWSEKIIAAAGIDGSLLPEAVPSTTVAGSLSEKTAAECGLLPGVKVVMGGGDGLCASVGAGSVKPGVAYTCLGSSAWVAVASEKPIYDEKMRLVNWAHIVPGLVAPIGTMQTAGAAFGWIKRELAAYETQQGLEQKVSPYEIINGLIAASKPGSNGLLFLPYLMGERSPRWNANARGAFVGLKMEHTRGDLFRSVIEGIAMNLRLILDIQRKQLPIDNMTVIGGLARGSVQRQIFADVFNLNIRKANYLEEATSMGAAITAGVGVGLLPGFDAVDRFIAFDDEKQPVAENALLYERMLAIFDQTYYALVDVYEDLAKLS
jgi:xylulokinase